MKRRLLSLLALTSILFFCSFMSAGNGLHLNGYSMSKEGETIEENGIEWQPVYYSEATLRVDALLPAGTHSYMDEGWLWLESQIGDTEFSLNAFVGTGFPEISTSQDLIDLAEAEGTIITLLDQKIPNIKFAVEFTELGHAGRIECIGRAYFTGDRLITITIDGNDLSLAPHVFNSLKFSK